MREHTKEGERNDKTLEQIVSFDLPPVSSVFATVSHRTTTRHAWCFLKRSLELGFLFSRERGGRKERQRYREIPARVQNPAGYGRAQKSTGIRARKRRTRRRSSRRNWSFRDFCRYSCVRFSRGIYWKGFLPFPPVICMYKRENLSLEESRSGFVATISEVHARAIESILLVPSFGPLAPWPSKLALSSSLIESPLYLRMRIEIYRRSRCSFRFNLLQRRPLFPFSCSPTSSNVVSFLFPFSLSFFCALRYIVFLRYHAVRTKMMHTRNICKLF